MFGRAIILTTLITTIVKASLPPDDNVLHIGGIFPIAGEGGWQGGQVYNFSKYSIVTESVNYRSSD